MNKLILALTNLLIYFCEKTGRTFNITGTGDDTDVYLIRYYVIQSKYFNFFIHRFLRSDRDDMHDHPWNFGTYVVKGGYREQVPDCDFCTELPNIQQANGHDRIKINERSTKRNQWATRKAEQLHRVVVDQELTYDQKDQATITLCFTGRTRRDWGFVKDGKWIFWKRYLGLPDDVKSRG